MFVRICLHTSQISLRKGCILTHPIRLAGFHQLASHKLGEEKGGGKELKGKVGREKCDNSKTNKKTKTTDRKINGYVTAKYCTLAALFPAWSPFIAAGSCWMCHDLITHLLYSHPKLQQLPSPYLVIFLPRMFCYSLSINASL